MDISDRIRQKMTEQNLKAVDIARMTGATKGSVSQWLNGISSPGGKYIVSLTKALHCDANWLFSGITATPRNAHTLNLSHENTQSTTKLIPVISHEMAFTWDKDSNHSSLGKDVLWEHGPSTVSQQAFWLEVVGDSMISPNGPSIGEGHLILVDPQLPAKNDCFVVAKFNNTRDITFKKLVIDARQTYLKPLNPDYRPTEFNNECQIIGVVVEAKYLF